jgi:hypothetical protein
MATACSGRWITGSVIGIGVGFLGFFRKVLRADAPALSVHGKAEGLRRALEAVGRTTGHD